MRSPASARRRSRPDATSSTPSRSSSSGWSRRCGGCSRLANGALVSTFLGLRSLLQSLIFGRDTGFYRSPYITCLTAEWARTTDAAACRTFILCDHRTPCASIPQRHPIGGVAGVGARTVGYFAPNGAHGHFTSARSASAPGYAELELDEYGMRVGFWRLRKMLGQVGAKP